MDQNELENPVTEENEDERGDFCGTIVDPALFKHDVTITKLIYDDPNSIERDESE
jgi:hypothetical protein